MEVLLDTNFILACLRRKIDIAESLGDLGFTPVIPREVMQELKDLKLKSSRTDKVFISLALEKFSSPDFKKAKVGGRTVDEGLISKGKRGIYIATLDSGIKRMVPNKIIIIDASNGLSVERA
ncbi:hypothetical protein J4461_01720 [Candidatus Pacearchaeota archaeon]|nr:hypothetical protein [Candidatus Pacearchaeota archaeon]